MKRIYLASPHMSDEEYERRYVEEAFDTNWLSTVGKNLNEFEKLVKEYLHVSNTVALASRNISYTFRIKGIKFKKR